MAPQLREENYDAGISAGLNAISAAVKGEYKAADRAVKKKNSRPSFSAMLLFLGVAVVFLSSYSRYLSGAAASIGLPLVTWLVLPTLSLALLAVIGIAGFFLGLFIASLFSGGGGSGGGFSGPYFGGGMYGGGSGGGDIFSGGSGDFGGGGASGDW